MSQENVEIVRRGYEAFNEGDLEGMVASCAPDFVYVPTGAIPGVEGTYRGPEEYKQQIVELFGDEFDDYGAEIHELMDAGDQVLVSLTFRGRGKRSGAESRWSVWQVWTVRDGSVVHGQGYTSRDEAVEAAGLSE